MPDAPSDRWKPVDTAPIKVNVTGLRDFAELVGSLTADFHTNLRQGVAPMMRVKAPFGGGLPEGSWFRIAHELDAGAAAGLLGDLFLGLRAVQSAAAAMYVDYATGDALTRDTVLAACYPAPVPAPVAGPAAAAGTAAPAAPRTERPLGAPGDDPDPGGPTVIDAGQPGEYTIPADADDLAGVPDARYRP
jgi:hypothetical protein